jgi:SH3 domain-containing YSC84-like protein 1
VARSNPALAESAPLTASRIDPQNGGNMKSKWLTSLMMMVLVMFAIATASRGQDSDSKSFRDAADQSSKAATVFTEIMGAPDQAIPDEILEHAECIMVFPQVIKAGFIVGGRGGRGVASCRTTNGWSAPAFFDLGGGSVGLQIGAQATDFVLVVMNKNGMQKLLGDKFELGADASAAAGPVGREAGLSTNIRMDAEILSYSRSKGLFAGLELKGVVIKPDKDDITAVYGPSATAKSVLQGSSAKPNAVESFPHTLSKYSVAKTG